MKSIKNRNSPSSNTTRKRKPNQLVFEKLPKCLGSRILDMETYKANCGKNLLIGYKSIKAAEETSMHPHDFVHVIMSKLKNYKEPVVVKIYDENNYHLPIEIKILEKIQGYRNTAQLICHFSCKDDKNNYFSKIIKPMKPIRFCANGSHSLHYFVYEYIVMGDISDFFTKSSDTNLIKSFVLQITAVIIQLASMYRICHGDINSGNIMIDTTEEKTLDYCIENQVFTIETHGIIPKMIDYGKSQFYRDIIVSPNDVWDDIIIVLVVLHRYYDNDQFTKNIRNLYELNFSTLTECYLYIRDIVL
jgi:serine/threonine protein kinase